MRVHVLVLKLVCSRRGVCDTDFLPSGKKDISLVEEPGGRKQLLVHMYSGKLNANGGGGTHPA